MNRAVLLLLFFLWIPQDLGARGLVDPDVGNPKPGSICRQTADSKTGQSKNRHNAIRVLGDVLEQDGHIVIIHHAEKWRLPKRMYVPGITLKATRHDEASSPQAEFFVSRKCQALYGCKSGLYSIEENGTLLPGVSVLFIGKDFVLLESRSGLSYMPVAGTGARRFRMVWSSVWEIDQPQSDSNGSAASTGNQSTRPQRKAPQSRSKPQI